MIQAGVRAVFFDAVGTMIHPDPPAATVYARVGRRFGSRLPAEAVRGRFAAAFRDEDALDVRAGLRTSEERELQRWRHIVARALPDVSDPDACFAELYRHFSLPEAWRIEPEAAAVLDELAGRGYDLGLASNYDRRLRSVVAGLPGLRRLGHLVISSEAGWRKPAPEFFAAVCRSAGLPPEQILHVGDDPANDYDGARAFGLRAVLLDPEGEAGPGTFRVARLGDLLLPPAGGPRQPFTSPKR
jgi:putative hydrolase of the HAD superfamily